MGDSRWLSAGADIALTEVVGEHRQLTVVIETVSAGEPLSPDVGVLLLGPDHAVRSSADLVYYNHPSGADGAVRLYPLGEDSGSGKVRRDAADVDLDQLPPTIDRLVVAASTDDVSTDFGQLTSVRMWVARADAPMTAGAGFEMTAAPQQRALLLGEVFRRDGTWWVRAVGRGYDGGLGSLATAFGVKDAENIVGRRTRPVRLPADWAEMASPYLPVGDPDPWQTARLFSTAGIKTTSDQELRAASITLSVMGIVREFGRAVLAKLGAPGGRMETFTDVPLQHSTPEHRLGGLIRVTRGATVWNALVEVKTGKATLDPVRIEYLAGIAAAEGFDAVVTISSKLAPLDQGVTEATATDTPVGVRHIAWEEILAEAALTHSHIVIASQTRARILAEFLRYACEPLSGMSAFDDMGKYWVKARESVKLHTIKPNDPETLGVCRTFEQLTRHIGLQLCALTGQRIASATASGHADVHTRAARLAETGELEGSLRVVAAAGPLTLRANLGTEKISCSITTSAPRSGRPAGKVKWLAKQLSAAPDSLRVTAHHAGSKTESTSALLSAIRDDPASVLPADGSGIREFTVTLEDSVASRQSSSESGFVTAMTTLANTFYVEVVQVLRGGRDGVTA